MHGGVLAISDVASTTQQIIFWLLAVVVGRARRSA